HHSVGEASYSTSAPFQVGYLCITQPYPPGYGSSLFPVPCSLFPFPLPFGWWLSLLRVSLPTEEFTALTIGLLLYSRPHWGLHVPHQRDAVGVGVGALFTPGSGCPNMTT